MEFNTDNTKSVTIQNCRNMVDLATIRATRKHTLTALKNSVWSTRRRLQFILRRLDHDLDPYITADEAHSHGIDGLWYLDSGSTKRVPVVGTLSKRSHGYVFEVQDDQTHHSMRAVYGSARLYRSAGRTC